jgi:hypothetical protein
VTKEDKLQWEARWRVPAAVSAFLAGVLLLAGTILLTSIAKNRPGTEARPDFLLSVHDSPGKLIAASALQGIAALLLIVVFYYLYRAIVHRTPVIPRWFVYIVVLAPLMYAVGQILSATVQIDVADTFAKGTSHVKHCPAIRGTRGEDCATQLLRDKTSPVGIALSLAGSVGTAFLFVMLPLRARRAGLMSQFMGILGVIAGALFVLPILPGVPVVVQAFWLGALGALYLGRWPGGGRGPAWETGEPDPWPAPEGRGGLLGRPPPAAEEGAAAPEPEPAPQRPSSRKRRRKKR